MSLTDLDRGTESATPDVPRFHHHPPYSPRRLFARAGIFWTVVAAVVALALAAAYDGGRLLLEVDEPVQRWIADNRTDGLTGFFTWASRLGDNTLVFPLGLLLAALVWRRCRFLSYALIIAIAVRPGFEFVLKAAVDRTRPDIDPLGSFMGPSHPSGHPLAAASVWGLLPPVVALLGFGRKIWWTVTGAVTAIIVFVALARVYRGAHWLTDVTASLLWGSLFLLAVELLYVRAHRRFDWHDPGCDPPK